ncbi:hypothetical protein K1719_026075 [Acacia pycnantha]|nr:hypothetical protein K1719_026075 [Acacia pycnantha]
MNLTAKAISKGGFEVLYKQNFATYPNEKLKKTFACHISTLTGPVSGTLYLFDLHIAFCSDSPISYTAPSGQQARSHSKMDGTSRTLDVNLVEMSIDAVKEEDTAVLFE